MEGRFEEEFIPANLMKYEIQGKESTSNNQDQDDEDASSESSDDSNHSEGDSEESGDEDSSRSGEEEAIHDRADNGFLARFGEKKSVAAEGEMERSLSGYSLSVNELPNSTSSIQKRQSEAKRSVKHEEDISDMSDTHTEYLNKRKFHLHHSNHQNKRKTNKKLIKDINK